ncbi:MAG: prepilin-type N-terminal cleavage/methylation domain-containing protein [Smithella sp.]
MNNKGFTIIEILTAMAVGTVVMAAVYAVIDLSQRTSAGIERRVAAQQDQKAALELMSMEIAMASYDPTRAEPWVNRMTCNGSGAMQNKGIQEATANAITIQMDINDDGNLCVTPITKICTGPTDIDTNEIIRYNYVSNLYITRSVNCGPAQAFLGASSANERAVRVINAELNVPLFRYFNGNGIELASPVATISNIRRILITLAVETENIDPSTGQRRRLVYSTSAIVRNHAPVF